MSTAEGCGFAHVPGPLGQDAAIDLVRDPSNPARVLALTTEGADHHLRLAETVDGAQTWQVVGSPLAAGLVGLTLEVAPSSPQQIYVTALGGPTLDPVLLRSQDAGQTWTPLPQVPTPTGIDYLAGIDPHDPERLLVRHVEPDQHQLRFSPDGGHTWQVVFTTPLSLLGFAISPDGQQVALATFGTGAGVWVAPLATLAFQKTGEVGARCLAWDTTGLYLCGDEPSQGFTVGVTHDLGHTVTALHHRKDLVPLGCPTGTRTGDQCPSRWPAVRTSLGIVVPEPAKPKPPTCAARPVQGHARPIALLLLGAGLVVRGRRPTSLHTS